MVKEPRDARSRAGAVPTWGRSDGGTLKRGLLCAAGTMRGPTPLKHVESNTGRRASSGPVEVVAGESQWPTNDIRR